MKPRIFLAIGVAACLCAPITVRGAKAPDLSTPSATIAAFIKALEQGNAAELDKCVKGTEAELAWIRAEAAQLKAFADLDAAMVRKFGKAFTDTDEGKAVREQFEGLRDDDLHADLKQAKIGEVKGDRVVVVLDESGTDDHQGRLLRVDGKWIVDLSALSDYLSPDDLPMLKEMAVTAADLAKQVAAGKFESVEQAGAVFEEKFDAAEERAFAKKPSAEKKSPPEKKPPGEKKPDGKGK